MLLYPKIDPVIFGIGPVKVHWYGLMYLLGFLCFLYMGRYRLKKFGHSYLTNKILDDFLFWGALGVVLGGRIGYCLFYEPIKYLNNPLEIFQVWLGGMSFHGGLLGVIIATFLFNRKYKQSFFVLADFIVPLVPMGLFFGRIGNFINGELWGRIANSSIPWAMVFPQSGSMLARHPSQIYEAIGEGLLMTLILWLYAAKNRKVGQTSGVFLIAYATIRFFLEYFREPDIFLISLARASGLSMGQWLCIPMFIIGILIFYKKS